MNIKHLVWDSDFFKVKVGALQLSCDYDVLSIQSELDASDFDVVYLSLDYPADSHIKQLEQVAQLYDRKVQYSKRVENVMPCARHNVTQYEGDMSQELLELAWISGKHSRFNLDSRFKPYFKELYSTWIEKSVSGEIADVVYVVQSPKGIKGFVTLAKNNNNGRIGLIAVHPDARGQGVGRSLICAANNWFAVQKCSLDTVITQKSNSPACQFYEKCGYFIACETGIFHWWRD